MGLAGDMSNNLTWEGIPSNADLAGRGGCAERSSRELHGTELP